MDSSHVRNHELTAEQSRPVYIEYTSGDDSNQNIDILGRAPIFKRKKTIFHPQTIVEHTQRSEHISQMNHESEEQLPTEGLPNSHNFEPVHNLTSDLSLIETIDDEWLNKPPSPHMPPDSQSSPAIDARNYATDGSKSEECTANEHIHEDTTNTCRPTHLKRKIEMDGKELPPTKMCSGTDHNLEIISGDKRVGLKRKIVINEAGALPSKVRCMNGDVVIELFRDDFKSEEAFRKFLIMKMINDRNNKNLKRQNERKSKKY
ncbi:hypothetical protein QAD02_003514 [Eretmocerus hayati]|uniref:Uncharacterized protein n=1 Tax=Eretmocerus hayati TaxID=131215 RepID=A0ACC2NRV4_9HYME|nr:hypothetical protein QAD02_003514 [Eretmocerus hayati]